MVIFIPLLAVLLWLRPMIHTPGHSYFFDVQTMPLYQCVLDVLPGHSLAGSFITLLFLVIQGFLLVRLNTKFIFINNRSYFPAFFFVILTSSVYDIQTLNPVVFSNFFLLLAFEKLFDSMRHERQLAYELFSVSFFISIGVLFYPFTVFLMVVIWIGLAILRPFNWREWIFTLLGLVTPFFLIDSYSYFLFNKTPIALNSLIHSFTMHHETIKFQPALITLFLYFAFLGIISSIFIINSFQGKKIVQRNAYVLFLWLFLNIMAIYFFIPQASVELIYFLAIPLSYLLANYFVFIRSKFWGNIFLILLLALVLLNQIG